MRYIIDIIITYYQSSFCDAFFDQYQVLLYNMKLPSIPLIFSIE